MADNYCPRCKKIISPKSKSCLQCHLKQLNKKGEQHPAYIDGRTHELYHCRKCNLGISYQSWKYGNQMCHSCSAKNNPKQFKAFGFDNPNCKDMITLKKLYLSKL